MSATIQMRETTNMLGGAPTPNIIVDVINNVYDNIKHDEALTGNIDYRAVDYYNNGDDTAVAVEIYIEEETASLTTKLDIGIEASHINSTLSIADESNSPAGVTFSHHITGNKLPTDNIPVGSYARLWIRRTADPNTENMQNDGGKLSIIYA